MFRENNTEEFNFFQDNKDMKLQRGLSNENVMNPFIIENFDWAYDSNEPKWNSFPNCSPDLSSMTGVSPLQRKLSENLDCDFSPAAEKRNYLKNEINDNASNVADTEEHATFPVENEKKCADNNERTKDLETEEQSYSSSIKFNEKDVDELLDMINRPSTDMNRLLSEVLTAGPTDPKVKRKRAITKEVKGKRVRKTKQQVEALTKEYEMNQNWENEDINAIASKLGLKSKQVYKWYWDQKKKAGELKTRNW